MGPIQEKANFQLQIKTTNVAHNEGLSVVNCLGSMAEQSYHQIFLSYLTLEYQQNI